MRSDFDIEQFYFQKSCFNRPLLFGLAWNLQVVICACSIAAQTFPFALIRRNALTNRILIALLVMNVLTALGCVQSAATAQNLIKNGSFESGTFVNSGDGFMSLPVGSTVITSWTSINAEMAWGTVPNSYSITPSDGAFLLDLTGYHNSSPFGGVTQMITTEIGKTYTLSLDLGTQESNNQLNGPIAVSVSAGSTAVSFTHNLGGSGNQWRTYDFDFTASSIATKIDIVGMTGKSYIGVDNVRVTLVPAPSALFTMLVGIVPGAMLLRRRRNSLRRRLGLRAHLTDVWPAVVIRHCWRICAG